MYILGALRWLSPLSIRLYLGSDHDLTVLEFTSLVGLCPDRTDSLSASLSLCSSPMLCLSQNKQTLKNICFELRKWKCGLNVKRYLIRVNFLKCDSCGYEGKHPYS